MGEAIFLTGVTGFLGKRLLLRLLGEERRIHVIVRDPSRLEVPEGAPLRIFSGDIADAGVVRRAMEGCDEGYHLAARVQHHARRAEYESSNVAGTRNVLAAAKELGLRKLVYASSIIVFANDPAPLKDETARVAGGVFNSDYHRTKYYAHLETMRFAAEGLPVVLVMPSSVFGPRDVSDANRVFAWCRRFKEGRVPRWLPDRGALVLNVVYGEDVAGGIVQAMRRGVAGEGYILGGENITIRELLAKIGSLAGDGGGFRSFPSAALAPFAAAAEALGAVTRTKPLLSRGLVRALRTPWAFSSEKAIRDLGYSLTPLDEALRATFESA